MTRKMSGRDLLALVLGTYAFLSPLWTTATTRSAWTVAVLGIATALAAVAVLLRPQTMPLEWFMMLMGALFVVSPWVMGFAGMHPMAWTAWIVGVVTFFVGLGDVEWDKEHRGHLPHLHMR